MGLLGVHVSIAGGLEKSVERALDLDLQTFQIFSKNQRQWRSPPLKDEDARKFRDSWRESGLGPFVVHDSYLINLGSPKENAFNRSVETFSDELLRAETIGSPYLVMHPGSHLKKGEEWGLKRIAEGLDRSVGSYLDSEMGPDEKGKTTLILLENTAGQGTNLGYEPEQLARIMDLSEHRDMLGICFDTCHAFASGLDISGEESYGEVFDRIDSAIGLDEIKVFHLNDSVKGLGMKVDRHTHIGEGEIGLPGFRMLLNDNRFEDRPMILETPGWDEEDRKNLKVLRSLID